MDLGSVPFHPSCCQIPATPLGTTPRTCAPPSAPSPSLLQSPESPAPSDPRHPSYSDGPSDSARIPPLVICPLVSPTGSLALSHIIRHVTLLRPNSSSSVSAHASLPEDNCSVSMPSWLWIHDLGPQVQSYLAWTPSQLSLFHSIHRPSLPLSASRPRRLLPLTHSLLIRKPSCQNRMFSPHSAPGLLSRGTEGTGLHRQRGHYWASGKMGYLCPWLRTRFHMRT